MGLSLLVSIVLSTSALDVSDPWRADDARRSLHVDIDDPWSDIPAELDRNDPWAASSAPVVDPAHARQIDRADPWAP